MPVIAQWKNKKWEVSEKKILALSALSTSYRLAKDENEDAEGKPAAYVRGLELQPLAIEIELSDAAGCNPLAEIRSWERLVGRSGAFVLGRRRFGAARFRLVEVNVSDVYIDSHGRIRSAVIELMFEENAEEAMKNKPRALGGDEDVAAPGIGGQDIASAIDIGASEADKAEKKPYRM